MSGQKDRSNQNRTRKGVVPTSSVMADALRAAGVVSAPDRKGGTDVKDPTTKPVPRVPEGQGGGCDADLFRSACEDVERVNLEAGANVSGGTQSSDKKGTRTRVDTNRRGSASRRGIKRDTRRGAGTRSIRLVDDVVKSVDGAGRNIVIIRGTWLEAERSPLVRMRPESPAPTTELEVIGRLTLRPGVLADDIEHILSEHVGPSLGDLGGRREGEIELVIGLDFGTSYCKVVVQEQGGHRAWAIPFSRDTAFPYLLRTKVWSQNGGFTLLPNGSAQGNLKMALYDDNASEASLINATAFIALVLRYSKAWFGHNKSMEFKGMSPFWFVHMGCPARDLQNGRLVRRFRKALWAGALLAEAAVPELLIDDVRKSLSAVECALSRNQSAASDGRFGEVHKDQVNLFPEIAAQIYGFLKSERFDPAQDTFLLVDVGGGTVDAGLFQVLKSKGGDVQFLFRATAVETLGVYQLHRERLEWHIAQLKRTSRHPDIVNQLEGLLDANAIPAEVPGAIQDYLTGAAYPERTCDWFFYSRFAEMLWNSVVMAARSRLGREVGPGRRLQFLLCGGGRSIALYDDFVRHINSPGSGTTLRLYPLELDRPKELEPRSIGKMEYHRLSVAYGLSFLDIGDVITPEKLAALPSPVGGTDIGDRYISKDMV